MHNQVLSSLGSLHIHYMSRCSTKGASWQFLCIYNFELMGPGDSLFPISIGPTANLWVQNTIYHDKLQYHCILGLAEIKTLHNEWKVQDVQNKIITGPLKTLISLHNCAGWSESSMGTLWVAKGPNGSSGGILRLWSDCANVQTDLNLCWLVPYGWYGLWERMHWLVS